MTNKKSGKIVRKIIILTLLIGIIIGGFCGYLMYTKVMSPNVILSGNDSENFFISSTDNYNNVIANLEKSGYIKNMSSFKWVAEKKNYPNKIKPGRYIIHNNISNNDLTNLLRSGKQTPVKVVFNKIRTKENLAGIIANQIEADSTELSDKLNNYKYLQNYNKTKATAMTLFIPNTYEFYWNTDADEFIKRMQKESMRFWNTKRMQKATQIGLTQEQVFTLASIVEEETAKNDEKNRVAGVYINRINKRIPLQADPTLRFALGDFSVKRILNKHKEIKSPYNTYLNLSLPPGPICLPSEVTIDAVLNYEKHNYLYFCAKDDFSGYHIFAKTLRQHNQNAAKYHRALNKMRVYK